MNYFTKSNRPENDPSQWGTVGRSIPAEEVEQVLRLAAQFSVQPDGSPVPVADLMSAAAAARIPPDCVERAIAQVSQAQARRQQRRRFLKRSAQTLVVSVVAIAAAIVADYSLQRFPLSSERSSDAPVEVPVAERPAVSAAPTVRTLEAHSGWQVFKFDRPVRQITRVTAAWNPHHDRHAQAGGSQKPWSHALPIYGAEHVTHLPANTLLLELHDQVPYPITGPTKLPVPVYRVRLRLGEGGLSLVEGGGRLKVYFE